MFLRCFNSVLITQATSVTFPGRNKTIYLDFLNSFEITSGWEDMTDTCKVVIPKNVPAGDNSGSLSATDAQGNAVTLQGQNINVGNGAAALFLRGDKISITAGYWYLDANGSEQKYVTQLFQGYITKVDSKLAITLQCEDNMWLLKQTPVPDQGWGNMSLLSMLQTMLAGSSFIANGGEIVTDAKTMMTFDIGTFITKGETVAMVLDRIKRDYHISSYMKGNELRVGYPTYWPEDVQNINSPYHFVFQQNIITDNLQYMRKDDIIMSATAQSFYSANQDTTTSDGQTKTRKTKLLVFIWADPKTQTLQSKTITDTSQIPVNEAGERYTFFFPWSKTTAELTNQGMNELQKQYYTGFRGSFTTFGMPYIPYGDNIMLVDNVLTDRTGIYKVKKVIYTGGIGIGIRQEIFLDYLVQS